MIESNELNSAGREGHYKRRGGESSDTNPSPRPFSDSGNLYDIPRPHPEDPPLRHWWVDDENFDQRQHH